MGNILYVQTDKNVKVSHGKVRLQDVAQVACADGKILSRCKAMQVLRLDEGRPGRYVVSAVDLIEKLQKENANLDVTHVGEPTFIVTFEGQGKENRLLTFGKVLGVCLTTFFGTAFSIMTFNNDVNVNQLFEQIYQQFTGQVSDGFTVLEIMYSLGIGLGVLFFFHHFGRRKFTQGDPTPMQVQMRLYEDDVDTTVIEELEREEKQ